MNAHTRVLCTALIAAAAAFVTTRAHAAEPVRWNDGRLVAENGMTIYTFDKDPPNRSACDEACLKVWPALSAGDAEPKAPFSVIARDDGTRQLGWNGKPLYLYAGDRKAGDANGDDAGSVWHVVRQQGSGRATVERRPYRSRDDAY